MKKWHLFCIAAGISSALLAAPAAAASLTDAAGSTAPSDWEISIQPKPTPMEVEAARWTLLHKGKDIHYNYEEKSLAHDAKNPAIIRVNVRAIYADPISVAQMDDKYRDQLNTFDSVSYSENLVAVNVNDHTITRISAKIFSVAGKIVDSPVYPENFQPIQKDTWEESLYYITQMYADTGRTGLTSN